MAVYVHTLANVAMATETVNGRFPSRLLPLPRLVVVAVLAAVWGVWVFCSFWLGGCVRRRLASELRKEVILYISLDQQAAPSMLMPGMLIQPSSLSPELCAHMPGDSNLCGTVLSRG